MLSSTKIQIAPTHCAGRNMWILKPPDLFAGMGIRLANTPKQVKELLDTYKNGVKKVDFENAKKKQKYRNSTVVLQKYIEKPFLYKKRKFDMRVWVLIDHRKKAYIFKKGHFKATSKEFDLMEDDYFTHITNFSLQKYNDDFQKFEVGNEISYEEFQV